MADKSAEDEERERDEILKRLLKTPPKPRPPKPSKGGEKSKPEGAAGKTKKDDVKKF